jgi:hypothetical protein
MEKSTTTTNINIAIALAVGLMTAIAATIAVVTSQKRSDLKALDFSDNWDDVLGI